MCKIQIVGSVVENRLPWWLRHDKNLPARFRFDPGLEEECNPLSDCTKFRGTEKPGGHSLRGHKKSGPTEGLTLPRF